jgi:predicted transcriptional regulator
MKEKSLNSTDKKVIDIFYDLGVPKNLAKTLMYISKVDHCRSAEIEKGANLRQPEVSVAMQQLDDLGWITKTNQKKEGKGRPIYIYELTSELDDIITHFEEEKHKEIETIKENLDELKNLISQQKTIQQSKT